ncbi:putative protein kinase PINOID [Iris pallida]|uniref:non-specific serine/threonine protein kinase n=1 Tax=Iris pallida TaxID=29817 RepID=A0AAX6GUZ4_IRIPA|nr:putative protein kinase PINOID [Iris pallida]
MDPSVDSDSNHSSMSSCSDATHRCSSFSRLSLESSASASAPDSSNGGTSSSPTAKDFKLIRRIGSGDIGTVYLCRRRDDEGRQLYAMKVVDREVVRKKKKVERAETEKKVLKLLRHPFLPTLYADFDASPNHSCLVMEYCSGGDLHSLRHHQPGFRFSLNAARFYAAEVLLSLEYLHLLGIVYRDLKPENILIRSNGHVMLSDFDLSLLSVAEPTVIDDVGPSVDDSDYDNQPSCFGRSKKKKIPSGPSRWFVAEPIAARSNSFVGTHEYVAPEVASGRSHGSSVDWWAYGVLLYELLYGSTPFVGPTNDVTLQNIIKKPLAFPQTTAPAATVSDLAAARDLIAKLLAKDAAARLGSSRGAADVKAHPFFMGLNFALLRSCRPPVVPKLGRAGSTRKPDRFDFF